jgi:glucose-6-phosphate 1-dehydrogenase
MDHAEFRAKVAARIAKGAKADEFLSRVYYYHGESYDNVHGLVAELAKAEAACGPRANRLWYLSLPPTAFVSTARAIRQGAGSPAGGGWTRIVIEKPFGHDLESSRTLRCELALMFDEAQIFRIDHYLGKQMVLNLLALRFANAFLSPLWSRQTISSVVVTFKEDIGIEGRGSYFDSAGIIRDVVQNHLM